MSVKIALIAAVAKHGAIGLGNDLLWRDAQDQRHFKKITLGHSVIMGRKTWDSLPERFRPLPDRRNIVVTRNMQWQTYGAHTVTSFEAALQCVQHEQRAFVIGGAQLYALALPLANELILTEIDAAFEADCFFPSWDRTAFEQISHQAQTDTQGRTYAFVSYQRKVPVMSLDLR
jgi:dihydrofolate reductase